jgi:hypothetical protein
LRVIEIEVHIPPDVELSGSESVVEAACAAEGLRVARKTTLATYPGSVHWHVKRGNAAGTLEITVWPRGRRAWLKVQAGRRAPWIDETMDRLRNRLEAGMATLPAAPSVTERTFGSVTPRKCPEDFKELRRMFEDAVAEEVVAETPLSDRKEP